MQAFLASAAAFTNAYLGAATGAIAAGVVAAGIDVPIPREVGHMVAFLAEVSRGGLVSAADVEQYLPPFLLDNWLTLLDGYGTNEWDNGAGQSGRVAPKF